MQSIGNDTLAAFMKNDSSKDFENPIVKSAVGLIGKNTNKKSPKNKDESDIAKYFKDSLTFSSKESDKENGLPCNLELGTIPESSENHGAIMNREQSDLDKYFIDLVSPSKCIKKTIASKSRIAIGKKCTRIKKSIDPRAYIQKAKEANTISSNSLHVIRESKNHEKRSNSSEISSAFPSRENSLLSLSEQKSSNRTTTNSSIEIPSGVSTPDRCKLASWGLPLTILRKYEARGLTSMFPWQVECLSNRELLMNNRNLVYSAPTSAGKTLIAEILVIKTVLERRKKVIFILPFVSVVREKMYYFQDLLIDSGLRVEGFMGGCSPAGGFAATDVAIATIEKANSLLNQLMEEGNLVNLGAVVIDELHLLGDPYRGYLLELLLTKLKYMTVRDELIQVQLIGMSATLPNLTLLAKWLNAELYKTDFRPVPLNELCKIGTEIYDNKMNKYRTLPRIPELTVDSDNILQLCIETISDGHSVLIFCPTKNWCEKLAQQVATTFFKLGKENTVIGHTLREQLSTEAIMETLEQLKRSPAGLDEILRGTVSFGTAFHHAGLTMDERDVIEGAFRSGALRILTATSTLSSGVNLPARRVIIRSLMFHGKPLDTLTYRQMIGRAGRMGKDTAGESILICKENETRAATTLLSSDLPPIESCLEGSAPLVRALLEAVASEVAYTLKDIQLYTRCTLASVENEELIDKSTKEAIKFLVDNELFMLQETKEGDQRWIATPLGKACLAASIPPIDGLFLFEELQKARRCFVLDTELHVIYLVTPLNSSQQIGQIDWFVFLDLWKSISESERRVGQMVGVDENFLMMAIRGVSRSGKILDVHKRFYTALALHELVREVPLSQVCRKYGCCRGVVQSLQQSAATFAGMVTQFCKKLGWNCMELLIGQFQARLQFGVCHDLLDLLRLPMLNGLRARSLYKEGITCVAELAVANELDVERALHKALPFESGKEHDGEHEAEAARRNKMRSVFVTGRDGLTPREAATILVREARTLVQNELGLDELQWKQREQSITSNNKSGSFRNVSVAIEKRNSGSISRTGIDDSVGATRGDTGREIRVDIHSSHENGGNLGEDGVNRAAHVDVENCEHLPKTTELNQLCSRNRDIDYKNCVDINPGDTFEFTNTGNAIEPERPATEPVIREEVCNDDIFEFGSTENANDRNEDAVRLDELHDDIFSGENLEFTSMGNVGNPKENVIGSEICEEICEDDVFEFTSTGNAVDLKQDTIGAEIGKEIGEDEIFEFTNTGNTNDAKEDVSRSTTCQEYRKENTFNFTETGNAIIPAEDDIGSKIRDGISKKNIFNFINTENATVSKEHPIGSKTREEYSRRNTFNFTETEIATDLKKNAISPNIRGAIGNGDIFQFTGTANPKDSEKNILMSKNKITAISPVILLKESLENGSNSRSPSLFGDSLNLDSQEINMLEQNIIDSLNISAFGDTNISGFAESSKNTPENRISDVTKRSRRTSSISQRRFSLKNTGTRRSPRISQLKNRSKSLVWDDDSWNNTNGIIETVNILDTAINSRVKDTKNVQDFKTPLRSKISEKPETATSSRIPNGIHEDRLTPKNRTKELQKIPQKRKLSEPNIEISPIASLLRLSIARKLSVDSNKSDSDDIVISSQSVVPSAGVLKNRTRLMLESLRKSHTQRSTNKTTVRAKKTEENHHTKDQRCDSCSIDSVISNSDDETPVKRTNPLERTKKIIPTAKPSLLRKRLLGPAKTAVDETRSKKPLPISPYKMQVVNVTANWAKFNQFKRDLNGRRDIALALACETFLRETISIGTKIIGMAGIDGRRKTKKIENCVYGNKKLCGVAISWDGIIVYYISFDNTHESKVPVKERLDLLTDILSAPDITVRCFSFKETYKILHNCCRITSSCKFLDPKTADWLLDPEHSERSFNALIIEYLPEGQFLLQRTGPHLDDAGPGLNVKSAISSEIRATTEAALTWNLTNALMMKLEARSSTLLKTFIEIEMGTLKLLARMELTGLGVNFKSLQELSEMIQQEMSKLENEAYKLAGKKFNFSSSKSVAQILGLYKGKKVSTKKNVLEHCENPISRLVISWRKLSTTQIKVVFPLLRLAECNSRIHGNCVTNTVTGRVSMFEPNLQNVPRDFNSQDDSFVISVRMAFVPIQGNVILSADYCQLELRILAHFSKDPNLCRILRKEGDVFKNIAARWYNVVEEAIDDTMRQRTKQLCYGMIYGMGVKTLAETLSVTETEAKEFLETFMGAYPGIRRWLTRVVEDARTEGYVTTLMHRRRFLPALKSEISSERSHAERQAVNTKVQGSAADIAKEAMVKIDERMRYEFPDAPLILADVPIKRNLRSGTRGELPRGGYLILQIHDELLYEVNAADLQQVGRIVKESMEKSCELRVPLPVKIKIGPTWGDLTEQKFENF